MVCYRTIVRACPALLLRGRLQTAEGVINMLAAHATPLTMRALREGIEFYLSTPERPVRVGESAAPPNSGPHCI